MRRRQRVLTDSKASREYSGDQVGWQWGVRGSTILAVSDRTEAEPGMRVRFRGLGQGRS